jgi:hypothetical protein
VTRAPAVPGGTLVLDSEGLAKAVMRDRTVAGRLALADDLRVITSAATFTAPTPCQMSVTSVISASRYRP